MTIEMIDPLHKGPDVHVGYEEILGVICDPSQEEEVTLEVFSTKGAFYICGVRSLAEEGSDLRITFLHPRARTSLFVENAPAQLFNTVLPGALAFERVFVPVAAQHVADDIEPMYCSEAEPLRIKIKGSTFTSLSIHGAYQYSVIDYDRPEKSSRCRGPYKFSSLPIPPMRVCVKPKGEGHLGPGLFVIDVAVAVCSACGRKAPCLESDGSGDEYYNGSICQGCAAGAFERFERHAEHSRALQDDEDDDGPESEDP